MSDLRDDLQAVLGSAYSVERELSGGGMSRVFVATERALRREIVAKILPADRIGGVSVERFHREIAVAARLQHPHIVPLLNTGEVAGLPYYTMPYVKGESLRAHLARVGALSVNETVHILRDVAAALAYAHAEGVVHRDIKPDNVILSGGVAVVTDFGVAKAMDLAATVGHRTSGLTSLGVALGTPAYMSPEQASADTNIDHRADVYSLGIMAYEMLTGAPPFAHRPPQQMLAAHVTETPDSVAKRRPHLPAPLAALVMRCLEKHPADRPQSADDIVQALDAIATPSGGMAPTGARAAVTARSRRQRIAAMGGVAALVVAAIVLGVRSHRPAPLTVGSITQITKSSDALNFDASISPDGKFVAYAAGPAGSMRIFVRQVTGSSTVALSQNLPGEHRWPRWSPDGSSIAFAASGRIYQVPALGGTPKVICDQGDMPSWSPDGESIAFVLGNAIWIRDLVASKSRQLDTAFQANAPTWSPDGHRIAYVRGNLTFLALTVGGPGSGSYGNVSPSAIWVVGADGRGSKRVTDDAHLNTSPAWLPNGRGIIYVSDRDGARDIYEQPLTSAADPDGDPERITTGSNAYTLTLTHDGTQAAYSTLQLRSNIWLAPIGSGLTPTSALRQLTNDKQVVEGLSISHDGRWLAFDSDLRGYHNIWKVPFAGGRVTGEPIALTNDSASAFSPRWSPGDSELVFHALPFGSRDIFTVRADGQGRTRVTSDPGQEYYPDWSPDGRRVVYNVAVSGRAGREVYIVERDARTWGTPRRISDARDSTIGQFVRWSPDGTALGLIRADGLWLLPVAGGPMRVVVRGEQLGETIMSLAWTPEGRTVVVQSRDSAGVRSYWRIDIAGARPQRILKLSEPTRRTRRPEFDTDGRYLFFTIASDEADVSVATFRAR